VCIPTVTPQEQVVVVILGLIPDVLMQGVGAVLVDQVGQVVADLLLRLLVLLRELLAPEEVVAELLVRLNWAVLAALVWLY
jgi:hypothetical protein